MRTELWGLRNTETQELVLTYWASSQKHKALFSTREKAEDACKHNPQYEPFRIEAEPVKHGKWDDSGRYAFGDGSLAIRCSECGCALHEDEYCKYYWNYCPNCGAKMDGGSNED